MLNTKMSDYVDIRIPDWSDAEEGAVLKIINGTPTWVNSISLISFEIEGYETYYAIEGMTWYEWCLSIFNPGIWNAPSHTNWVYESDYYVVDGGGRVLNTDKIEANGVYWTEFDNVQDI